MGASCTLFSLVLLFHFLNRSSSQVQVKTIHVRKAKELLDSGYVYIDVRTKMEFEKGHVDVEKIINIPYMFFTQNGRVKNPKFLQQVRSMCNKDKNVVVGCLSGARSLNGTIDLHQAGFKNVNNLGGGYLAWVENDLSIKKQNDDREL